MFGIGSVFKSVLGVVMKVFSQYASAKLNTQEQNVVIQLFRVTTLKRISMD